MLTRRQRQLLEFLTVEAEEGRCPSFDEMRRHLGLASKGVVHGIAVKLEERGFIRRRALHRERSIEVVIPAGPTNTVPVPFYGRLNARAIDGSYPFRNHRTVEEVRAAGRRA